MVKSFECLVSPLCLPHGGLLSLEYRALVSWLIIVDVLSLEKCSRIFYFFSTQRRNSLRSWNYLMSMRVSRADTLIWISIRAIDSCYGTCAIFVKSDEFIIVIWPSLVPLLKFVKYLQLSPSILPLHVYRFYIDFWMCLKTFVIFKASWSVRTWVRPSKCIHGTWWLPGYFHIILLGVVNIFFFCLQRLLAWVIHHLISFLLIQNLALLKLLSKPFNLRLLQFKFNLLIIKWQRCLTRLIRPIRVVLPLRCPKYINSKAHFGKLLQLLHLCRLRVNLTSFQNHIPLKIQLFY